MIHITEEMRQSIDNARTNGTPCVLATASSDGVPNAGFRGSIMVFDDGSMAYRERTQLSSLQHLEKNPKVVILYRDPARDIGWKFRCTAAVHATGSVYRQVMDRLAESGMIQDPDAEGVAVVLQVDQIVTLSGEVLQERVPNLRW